VKTHYATPQRTGESLLRREIDIISGSPVVSGLLRSVCGLLAVLDRNRQIVSINDSFLKMLGIDDPQEALGLRPGEALGCVHAHDEQAGCGTSEYCSTCGAAIAIVAALGADAPSQRICALTARRNGSEVELAFMVRSQPIEVEGDRYILLFLQDITAEQHRAALERTFFHDISNMVHLLMGTSELLAARYPSELAEGALRAAKRLRSEIDIQKMLLGSGFENYTPIWRIVTAAEVMNELQALFINHPACGERTIAFPSADEGTAVFTDFSLLMRILSNMLINALEAGGSEDEIRLKVTGNPETVQFSVWNPAPIPPEVQKRLFQRNFSTKTEPGRGTGTYSMKLLGEKLLGGRVSFTSSEQGTEFTFSCPAR
jgi:signal transduction histidine kinase